MTVLIWPFFNVEVLYSSSPDNHMYHHSSATNGPRLLKFSVHLPFGITPGRFWNYCDRVSGCRPLPKIHLSATNGPRLLKFSVHLYGITPGCFWTYCDRVSGCRPAPQKFISRQPMDLGFWNFLYIFMELRRDVFELIATVSVIAARPPKNSSLSNQWT